MRPPEQVSVRIARHGVVTGVLEADRLSTGVAFEWPDEEIVVYTRALPSTLSCTTTDEDGDWAYIPLRPDTVSSADALRTLLEAAAGWGEPVCAVCQEAPKLKAYREDEDNEELLIELDHDDPAVTTRLWVADVRHAIDCEHAPTVGAKNDRPHGQNGGPA
jgi:hypothetical protein